MNRSSSEREGVRILSKGKSTKKKSLEVCTGMYEKYVAEYR